MPVKRVDVNSKMLKWAREKAGYDLVEAAHRLGFRDSSVSTAVAKLEQLESGEQKPTLNQTARLAQIYRRPKMLFFLAQPPVEDTRLTDYRRLSESRVSPVEQGWLDSLQRLILNRVDVLRELLESDEDRLPPDLPYSCRISDGEEVVAARICEALNFDPSDVNQRGRNATEFFRVLRAKTEDNAGIFTFLVSKFGMGQPDLPPSVYRGFAIADKIAPAVVINGLDSDTAKVFSLFHELAHIALGDSSISGDVPSFQGRGPEAFCNRVAATILLPDIILGDSHRESPDTVREIALTWRVSPQMTAYRLHGLGLISTALRDEFVYQPFEARRKRARSSSDSGGPTAHQLWKSWIGAAATGVIGGAVDEGRITTAAAARAFGIKPTSLHGFLAAAKKAKGGVY